MKKYFVVSDIHSFYDELITALNEAGYDKDNPEHTLIVVGDIFDRGDKSYEVFKFLTSLPKDRRVFIKGNHEELFMDLLKKSFPQSHDFHNGTVATFCQLAGLSFEPLRPYAFAYSGYYSSEEYLNEFLPIKYWKQVVEKVKEKKEILDFLTSDEWKDYYELGDYIFVHSFIPTYYPNQNDLYNDFYFGKENLKAKRPIKNWRQLDSDSWGNARWGCPYQQYLAGLFQEEEQQGKVLVVGHWHTSDFHDKLGYGSISKKIRFNSKGKKKVEKIENFNIFNSPHLIAIDGCTAISKKVNVLVIDEQGKRYQFGKELENMMRPNVKVDKLTPIIETVPSDFKNIDIK